MNEKLITLSNLSQFKEKLDQLYETIQNASDTYVQKETGKGLSTNDYTTTEKNKLAGIESGAQVNVKPDWNAAAGNAAEILNKPNYATDANFDIDDSYEAVTDTTGKNPANEGWYERSGTSPNYTYTKTEDTTPASGKTYYTGPTYVITLQLLDQNNTAMGAAKTIDLPLESVVVSGSYDSVNKKVILTLKDGSTVEFSVADLVSGLQSEITSANKLSADLVQDGTNNKVFTAAEQTKLGGIGITVNGGNKISADANGTIALTIATAIDDLTDVSLTSLSDGQILVWDANNNVWKNANAGAAPGNGILTIQQNGTTVDTFNANQSNNTTVNIVADANVIEGVTIIDGQTDSSADASIANKKAQLIVANNSDIDALFTAQSGS